MSLRGLIGEQLCLTHNAFKYPTDFVIVANADFNTYTASAGTVVAQLSVGATSLQTGSSFFLYVFTASGTGELAGAICGTFAAT